MARSGDIVGSGADVSHCGGTYDGTSGVTVGAGDGVLVVVGGKVGVGIVVGGAIICVTKLHDNNDKTSNPKKTLFIFICSIPSRVPINQRSA